MPVSKKPTFDGPPGSVRHGRPRAKPTFIVAKRGVKHWREASEWLKWRGIEDIECITPDLAGVPRGKMMPTSKFTSNTSLALPSALYRHTISGEYPEETGNFRYEPRDSDLKLVPDLSTLSIVPWETDPTAQVICDIVNAPTARPSSYTPRNVLKQSWCGFIATAAGSRSCAPEIEFYLVAKNDDPDYPLHPPKGRSGRLDPRRTGLFDRRHQRVRRADRRHLPFLGEAGPGDRHADPRGRAGAARDQPAPRRPDRACRPGLHVQADASARRR
jgi:hypothetical protein